MKVYKVVLTYTMGPVITVMVRAWNLDNAYKMVSEQYPRARMIGPSAILRVA
jgi:hypothetical protein